MKKDRTRRWRWRSEEDEGGINGMDDDDERSGSDGGEESDASEVVLARNSQEGSPAPSSASLRRYCHAPSFETALARG